METIDYIYIYSTVYVFFETTICDKSNQSTLPVINSADLCVPDITE